MSTSKNSNLIAAASAKKDEFYTQFEDIERDELNHEEYREFFCGKTVLCNCDDLDDIKQYILTHGGCWERLKGNGDFRSPECIEILKEADVVVTNPPFSLFREYVAQLRKIFVIVGNLNAITYKEIFPLIQGNKIWTGYNTGHYWYHVPDH